jgi:hypothetical protein
VTVTNDLGGSGQRVTTVNVTTGTPPVVTVPGGLAVLGLFSGTGSFSDNDLAADTFTATVNYGDGTGTQPLALSGSRFTLSHNYPALPLLKAYTVTVTITDDDGVQGVGTATVTTA